MPENSFATVLAAVRLLQKHGRRIGRTHIHKFLFLAQAWRLLPETHRFSLYLHGPYSRQLDSDLLALRAAGIVTVTKDPDGYGARYSVGGPFAKMADRQGPTMNLAGLEELAGLLGPMLVRELEATSTCEYVRLANPSRAEEDLTKAVRLLKPHLSEGEVKKALRTLSELRAKLSGA